MIIIEIQTDSDAFKDGNNDHEVTRILYKLAERIERGTTPETLIDIDGNTVGTVKYD